MEDTKKTKPRAHEFAPMSRPEGPPRSHLNVGDIKDVRLIITADLGRCTMLVRDVLELQPGSLVQLDKLAGEMTDIYLNGLPLAKGEVVVIGDALHVRVGEILGEGEKPEEVRAEELAEQEEDEEI